MTKIEYTRATNLVKVSVALHAMRDVLPGNRHGISAEECDTIRALLLDAENRLFGSFKVPV